MVNKSVEEIIEYIRKDLSKPTAVPYVELSIDDAEALVSYFDDLKTFENSI